MRNNKRINNMFITLSFIVSALLFAPETFAQGADSTFNLYVGDTQTINLGPIKRVAVGRGGVISTSILDDGDLLMLAEGAGETEMTVWLDNADLFVYLIIVQEKNIDRIAGEVADLLSKMPSITIRRVGKMVVLEGGVDENGKALIEKISGIYTDTILDMTKQSQVGAQKMVYMNVQITEFNTNKLRSLGINWQTSFNGPRVAYTRESIFDNDLNGSLLNSVPAAINSRLPLSQQNRFNNEFGFFGIATEIISSINLARNSGDAIILAEPSLSARSGGEAEFLSGGEIPLPVTSNDGQASVEFKEFGIKLRIKPTADDAGNIIAEVETELSTVDPSLSVGGIPGFRTRKASTDASLKNGQTLVISGLVNRELSDNTTGFAFLSKIPVLGALFRSKDFRNNKSELVIFVTPYIYDELSDINLKAIERSNRMRSEFLENIEQTADILE
ncbi:MAG: pilus assembly protein CpaC [Cryomorphaceae bacterium]|jgi:pilus assembly protein CpaC